jgi:hypothetical protein
MLLNARADRLAIRIEDITDRSDLPADTTGVSILFWRDSSRVLANTFYYGANLTSRVSDEVSFSARKLVLRVVVFRWHIAWRAPRSSKASLLERQKPSSPTWTPIPRDSMFA